MMDEPACHDREELAAYLYDECDAAERLRLAAHFETCAACRFELEELQQVRRALGQWAPPERSLGFGPHSGPAQGAARGEGGSASDRAGVWGGAPFDEGPTLAAKPWWDAWRMPLAAAASILVLAGAAGLAHVEVRYGPSGVVVRTGWSSTSSAAVAVDATPEASAASAIGPATDRVLPTAAAIQTGAERISLTAPTPGTAPASRRAWASARAGAPGVDAPWQSELSAFEARIERELNGNGHLPSQAGLLQQVQSIVQASEQRQQRQFALRLNEAMRELESQRRADLVRIDQSFGQIEGTTGAAVAQQRELWNYLVRVAQHPQ